MRSIGMFCRLDTMTGQVDTAYVKWFVDDRVLYDVVEHDGTRFDNRIIDEATFMNRWFVPERR